MEQNSKIVSLQFLSDVRSIIEQHAYKIARQVAVVTYWNIGKRIVEEEQQGEERAEYGKRIIETLSASLVRDFGNSYNPNNLRAFRSFYLKFNDFEIWNACVPNLQWTHFRSLLRVEDDNARHWYMREASREMWKSRTLDRNIASQYYYHLLQSPQKEEVIAEMRQLTAPLQSDAKEFVKSPVVAEFLGLSNNAAYTVVKKQHQHVPALQNVDPLPFGAGSNHFS